MHKFEEIDRPGLGDLALLLFTAIVMASAFVAIKIVVQELGPLWTAALRVSIGFSVVLPFAIFGRTRLPEQYGVWGLLTVIALLNMVIPFAMISWGLKTVDAGIAALLMGTTPFMAMVLGHFFTSDEKINRYKIIAVILAMSGIIVIVGPEMLSGLGSVKLGSQLAIMCGAWCYVIAGLFMRRLDMKAVDFTVIALGLGSFMLVALAAIIEGVPTSLPARDTLLALLWLGAFPTGLAYLLRFFLVKRVGVGTFALGMNTIPVIGVIFGAVVLGEAITVSTVIALVLVVCGLLVARFGMPTRQVGEHIS